MALKKKFLIILSLALVTTIIVFSFTYERLKTEMMSTIGSLFLKKQIQFNRERVLHPLMRELALAQKLAASPLLKEWAENEKDPELKKKGITELESFRRFFFDKSYFFAVHSSRNYYFNDSSNSFEGKQLRYKLNPDNPENRWFFATIESEDNYRLNVDYDEKLGVTKVWINVVVKKENKPIGIVGTGIDLTNFIHQVIGSTQTGITNILIEEDGAIQAHSRVEKIDFRSISKTASDKKTIFQMLSRKEDQQIFADEMRNAKSENHTSSVFFVNISGRKHLIGLSYIKEIGWYNVSILDIETVVGKSTFFPFAALLISALLFLSCIIYLLLSRFIFRRVERLDKSVSGFAKGILPDYPDNSASDEFGYLEDSFKKMVKVVKNNTEDLELRVMERTSELELKNKDLKKALDEIKVLSGLLPICSHCKNIRDDKGYWHQVEEYVGQRTNAQFSHGICPVCMKKHYPKYFDKKKE